MKKTYLAELIGTFGLSLMVLLAVSGEFVLPVPVLASLTLAFFVYSIGHISGCHINPAVTIGLLSLKKITGKDALGYVVSQFAGAFLALLFAHQLGVIIPAADASMAMIGAAEAVGTAFFTFGIASVVFGKVDSLLSGAMVGGSLLLGVSFSVLLGAGGVLNPAVAYALQLFSPMYVLGPIFGSLLGFNLYAWLNQRK